LQVLEIPDTSYVYFHIAEFQGLYDTSSQTLNTFVFVPTLKYIKKGGHSQELIFVTEKGSFIYNINTKVFTYFYLFLDYVSIEDGYIGVIYKDEDQKKKNYDLNEETQNLIIRFDPSTKEREILYRTSLDVKKILKEGDQIYFETSDGKYKLENY